MGNDYWTNGGPIKAFSSFREAQAFAAKLRAHEADGWQYEVRSVGPDCEFVIGTYDLDWRFYGYWREPEVSEAPAWPTIVSAATPASGAPKMAEEREVNAWRDVPVSSPACENCSGPLPDIPYACDGICCSVSLKFCSTKCVAAHGRAFFDAWYDG